MNAINSHQLAETISDDDAFAPNAMSYNRINHWLLPDGVHDVLFADADKQQYLRQRMIQLLQSHGYQLVAPPLIEFTESLLGEASEDLKRQTFKLIDQATGRLMGLRADTTTQIRRIDAKFGQAYFADSVARYCYAGHVIHTLANGLFGSRTPLQLGAELFGCDDLAADFELLDVLYALIADLPLSVSWHLDLGHVGVFKRLSELANLDNDTSSRLMQLYAKKALPELSKLCQVLPLGQDFFALAEYGHDLTQLSMALSDDVANDDVVKQSLAEIKSIYQHLSTLKIIDGVGNDIHVSIDLTELSGYHYHTGMLFNLYVNNETQAVARGGRFYGQVAQIDQRISAKIDSNQKRPAIGFSMDITRLLPYVTEQNHQQSDWIWVNYADLQNLADDDAQKLAKKIHTLRQQGHRIIKPLHAMDKPNNITHHLKHQQGQWVLTAAV